VPVAVIGEGGNAVIGLKKDTAAAATVAAVWAAGSNILFPAERNRAVAAVTRFNMDFCLIYKHKKLLRRCGHVFRRNKINVFAKCILSRKQQKSQARKARDLLCRFTVLLRKR
jgi:hypothetical protein